MYGTIRTFDLPETKVSMALRYALICSIALGSISGLQAQGIVTLTNEEGEVVNGTVIEVPCQPENSRDTISLFATLNGSTTTEENLRRYEVMPVEGSRNFFCWGVCYAAQLSGNIPAWVSVHPVTMEPATVYDNFHGYYQPEGNPGTARFRFVWFATSDPNGADSSWVDVDFACGAVGIGENQSSTIALETWPNPSMGSDVSISHQLDRLSASTELVIYTVIGERISAIPIRNVRGVTKIAAGTLQTGVYFANVEQDGNILATKRIVITN